MNNQITTTMLEIMNETSLIKGGIGITTNKEISIDLFYNWYFNLEQRSSILNILIESFGKEKEVLIPYLKNIKFVLEKGKWHYLEVAMNPMMKESLQGILSDNEITFDSIYNRFDSLIIVIDNKLAEIQAWKEFDDRIKGKLSSHEVLTYFKQLCNFPSSTGEKKVVLIESDVLHLVYSNFAGFSEKRDKHKFETPNIKQIELRKFVYEFYRQHSLATKTDSYIHFLKDNFTLFDNMSVESLNKCFSR